MFSPTKIALLLSGLFSTVAPVPFSNRNDFVDGAMSQATASPGTLAANAGTYVGPTMWRVGAGAGGAGTVTIVDMRGTADMLKMEGADTISCFKVALTAGSSGSVAARTTGAFWQPIENAGRYGGRSVTVSFKLKADAAITIPALIAQQNFGTGGSPSALVVLDKTVTWAVGTTFKKFSVRIDFPNVTGKTFGTNGDSSTGVGLWFPPGTTTTGLYIAEAQIELSDPSSSSDATGLGGAPTTFEHRGPQAELARVKRYYNACYIKRWGASTGAQTIGGEISYPDMRATPAAAFTNPTYTNCSAATLESFGLLNTAVIYVSTTAATSFAWNSTLTLDARI